MQQDLVQVPPGFGQFPTMRNDQSNRSNSQKAFSFLPAVLWNIVAEYAADTPWHTLRSIVLVQQLNTEHVPRMLLERLVTSVTPMAMTRSSTEVDSAGLLALVTAVVARDPNWVLTLLHHCNTIGKLLRPITSSSNGWLSPILFMGVLCRKGLVDTVDTRVFDGLPAIRAHYSSGICVGIDQNDMSLFDTEGLPLIIFTTSCARAKLQQTVGISSYTIQDAYASGFFCPEGAVKMMKVHDMLVQLVLWSSSKLR